MSSTAGVLDLDLCREVFLRVASDLAMIANREFLIEGVTNDVCDQRPSGEGSVHISFKLALLCEGRIQYGCLLMPLADAITMASYLLMVPDEEIKVRRTWETIDDSTKDAMMEIGNFVGSAVDAALRSTGRLKVKVRSAGCQGVRAGVRPAFPHEEGDPLVVCTARAKLHIFPETDMLLVLPELG